MNKLQRELIDTINNKRDKFNENFELFYNNEEYWNESIADDIIKNITYSQSCNGWIEAIMFYGYRLTIFPQKFLLPEFDDVFKEDELTIEEVDIIHDYFIDRFVVSLIVENKVNKTYLQS